ncbi:hypothetical protein HMPREF9135_2408 [Segatella baroniae F0067]|uniref:Uncharacterized protein n=1 Tax=Segatella baroniae F0067 TaxID=1115809 RepID=U2QK25_9BACT|nr:hypothetical protein [Segatella baroniae]ERK39167.1 hypothetical protein HMPREF9135_2408 [Segatella baroniae F0067]
MDKPKDSNRQTKGQRWQAKGPTSGKTTPPLLPQPTAEGAGERLPATRGRAAAVSLPAGFYFGKSLLSWNWKYVLRSLMSQRPPTFTNRSR